MKIKNLLLLLSLSCTIVYAEISDNDIESIENLSDQVLGNKKLAKLEPQIKAQIKKSQPTVQQLFKAEEIDYNDSVYLHNYAIITSGYAEYLLDQHCTEQSHPIQPNKPILH